MRFLRRSSAVVITTLGLGAAAFIAADTASAHVTVAAPGVAAGASDAVITFHVPDESDSAGTVGLKIQLPTDHPIAGVLVAPKPGWTAKITQTKLTTPLKTDDGEITEVVSEIDWTAAAGSAIEPGFFGEFTVIGGKLPDEVDTLVFKAIQTYSDKSVVSWIEQAAPGSSAEPDHPAPTLELTAAPASAAAGPTSSASPTVSAVGQATFTDSSGRATTALVLGIVGVVLGAGALTLTVLRRRSRVTD